MYRSVDVRTHAWTDWPALRGAWERLEATARHSNIFFTAGWVSAWLSTFGDQLEPTLVVFSDTASSDVVGMCLLVSRNLRRGPFRVRCTYLNTAGEDQADETVIEHNTLLTADGWERDVAGALRNHVDQGAWDEFVASGMADGPFTEALIDGSFSDTTVDRSVKPSYYVDLTSFGGPEAHLASLSRNTREKVRRSQRQYEKSGKITVEAAASVSEARAMLDELAELHQTTWLARGRPGVFSSPRFSAFQHELIERAFPMGGIQVVRVRAGGLVIGLLYSFVHRERVAFYQSGLYYGGDNRLKPGLVAHAAVIEHNRKRGMREYDFLAGDDQYKQSLSNGSRNVSWLIFRKRTFKAQAINILRGVGRGLLALKKSRDGGPSPASEVEGPTKDEASSVEHRPSKSAT